MEAKFGKNEAEASVTLSHVEGLPAPKELR
jgi:hypothetical protein